MLILQLKINLTKTEIPTIHLKNNGPHIKVPLIFWLLIMTFNLCSYHQLWVKWACIHIGNSSGHIGQTHSRFPKCLWMSNWHP